MRKLTKRTEKSDKNLFAIEGSNITEKPNEPEVIKIYRIDPTTYCFILQAEKMKDLDSYDFSLHCNPKTPEAEPSIKSIDRDNTSDAHQEWAAFFYKVSGGGRHHQIDFYPQK